MTDTVWMLVPVNPTEDMIATATSVRPDAEVTGTLFRAAPATGTPW